MENEKQGQSLARSTARVSAGTLTSRILGMARMSVMSGLFGASDANDAFVAAYKIPNLLRDMFAEGALSAAFIPVFTTKLKEAGKSDAFRLANLVLSFLLVVVGALVVIGILLAPAIVSVLAPGFQDIPGKFELTVLLGRVMMPFLLIVSIAALLMGMLNSFRVFGTPAFAPAVLNIGMILSGFLICPFVDPPILGMSIGLLLGGLGQLFIQLPQAIKQGFRFKLNFSFGDPTLKLILKLAAPMVIGLAATQINVFIVTNLASTLSDGAVSYIDYAYRILHLPLGLFAVAIATVTLPDASRLAASGDYGSLGDLYARSLRFALFLVLPAQAVLLFAGEPIIALLYQHHEFGPEDTVATAAALRYYSVGVTAFAMVRITVPIYYAMKETRIPVAVSVIAVVVNVSLCFALKERFDYVGLTFAASIAGWVNFGVLLTVLSRRIGFESLRRHASGLVTIIFQSVIIAALLILAQKLIPLDIVTGDKIYWLIYTAALLGGAVAVYLGISLALGLPELDAVVRLIKKRR